MKAFYGDKATAENSWGFDWLPKWDKGYDVLQYFEMMHRGQVNGYICRGFNPVASFPNKNKVVESLSKLKFLITIDPLNTETSTFWQNHGESNDVDPSKFRPKCSVCHQPASRKRTVLSSTLAAGCSGTGKVRTPRASP